MSNNRRARRCTSLIVGAFALSCSRTTLEIRPGQPRLPSIASLFVGPRAVCVVDIRGHSTCDGYVWDGTQLRALDGLVAEDFRTKGWQSGNSFVCRIDDGDDLRCIGANTNNQLGVDFPSAARQWTLADRGVLKVVSAEGRTCILHVDGHVRCRGLKIQSTEIVDQPLDGSDALDLAMLSNGLVCVLRRDHSVACVGRDPSLGSSPNANVGREGADGTLFAQPIDRWTNVRAINSTDGQLITAVHIDGRVSIWGGGVIDWTPSGYVFLVGSAERPTILDGVQDVVEATSASRTVCARTNRGEVFCMGLGSLGQLGDGSPRGRPTMGRVALSEPVTSLRGFGLQICAAGEQLHCWGLRIPLVTRNPAGTALIIPTPLFSRVQPTQISLGVDGGFLLNSMGQVTGWARITTAFIPLPGETSTDFVGTGASSAPRTPTPVSLPRAARMVVARANGGAAILDDGSVVNWGGHGVPPQRIELPDLAANIIARGRELIVQLRSRRVVIARANPQRFYGEVIPADAVLDEVQSWNNAMSVAANLVVACAVTQMGAVECLGDNTWGGLGRRGLERSATPVTVALPDTAVSVHADFFRVCAILRGGSVYCWGDNELAPLGLDRGAIVYEPVAVSALSPAIDIASGNLSTCALMEDRRVRCTGSSILGSLGIPLLPERSDEPVTLPLTEIESLEVAGNSFCAIRAGALPQCWGSNLFNEFGLDSPPFDARPVVVRLRD